MVANSSGAGAHASEASPLPGGVGWPGTLPGRPLTGGPPPGSVKRAVCCSGGGIRATAFSLGGLQRLGRRGGTEISIDDLHANNGGGRRAAMSWFDRVELMTGVSGGAHIAGSFAMVHHAGRHSPGFRDVPVYAPGSPEDNRLRAHTRYLLEGPHAVATGVLAITYGLILNLLPVLAALYLTAKFIGWLILMPSGLLHVSHAAAGGRWELGGVGWWAIGIGGLATLGLLFFAAERFIDVYARPSARRTEILERGSLDCLATATIAAVLLLAVPALLMAVTAIDTSVAVQHIPAAGQVVSFTGTVVALVALVKTALGRFSGSLQTSATKPGPVTGFIAKHIRAIAPWLGSLLAVALLLLAFLVWVNNAVALGPTRGQIIACAVVLGGSLLWRLCTDINRTSIHPFYKARLCSAFAVMRTPNGAEAVEQPYDVPIRFSEYAGDTGFPTLVVCASVRTAQAGAVPAGRDCAPFTFSPYWTGISAGTMFTPPPGATPPATNTNEPGDTDARDFPTPRDAAHDRRLMLPTYRYERRAGIRALTLPGAIAVSGASVLPQLHGSGQAPLRFLLALANVRLGLWLPNPLDPDAKTDGDAPMISRWPRRGDRAADKSLLRRRAAWLRSVGALLSWQWHQPGIRSLMAEMTGRTRLDKRWIYVSDGGDYDSLGLVEALRRGATEIVVLDATGDEAGSWEAFTDAVELARADLGVTIEVNSPATMTPTTMTPTTMTPTTMTPTTMTPTTMTPTTMTPAKELGPVPVLAAKRTFRYPNGTSGAMYLCRLSGDADPSLDLQGDREFEAYRWFGEVAADLALTLMTEPAGTKSGQKRAAKKQRSAEPAEAPAPVARASVENADGAAGPAPDPIG